MGWEAEAERLWSEGKSWDQTASKIQKQFFPDEDKGRVKERVRSYIRRTPEYKKGKITYEDKRDESPTSVDELWETVKQLNKVVDDMDTKQTNATIKIDDDKPIGIAFWGDWHVGSRGVDYNRLEEDRDIIAGTDGLYHIKMGDYKDNANALIHANSVQEDIAGPTLQEKLVISIVEDTADGCLAIVRGCHDDWSYRLDGRDFIQQLCYLSNSVNLWHGGIINIKLGDQIYRIGARHKYKWESGLNTTNAQRNFVNDWGACDVVCFAHKHYPDLQHTKRMGNDVVYARSGAYKLYDEFGQKLAGYEGQHGVPVMILFPDSKEMIPFKSLEHAVKCLKMYRN